MKQTRETCTDQVGRRTSLSAFGSSDALIRLRLAGKAIWRVLRSSVTRAAINWGVALEVLRSTQFVVRLFLIAVRGPMMHIGFDGVGVPGNHLLTAVRQHRILQNAG